MKIILTLFTLLTTFLALAFFFPVSIGSSRYVDFTSPSITIEQRGGELSLKVSDDLNAIVSVRYLVQQSGETQIEGEILHEASPLLNTHELSLDLGTLQGSLAEGAAEVIVTAQDAAIWGNVFRITAPITLDFSAPSIEVLSQQHRIFAGGAELVLFQAADNMSLKEVWLSAYQDKIFAPFKLIDAYPELDLPERLYGVLFATPRGLAREKFQPTLHATDNFGNSTERVLSLRFEEQAYRRTSPKLSSSFLSRKIPPLVKEMKQDGYLAAQTPLSDLDGFKVVNEQYREKLVGEISTAMEKAGIRADIPTQHFQRPMAGTLTSRFGEFRTYLFEGKSISTSFHDGQDIASVVADNVRATAAGNVLLAEQLGIYGNTILIDHGAGITSLYGHLSSFAVQAGETVNQGDLIGQSGTTGLAGGDHLHFEIHIQGVPVTPIEWWDPKWFQDNIEQKLTKLLEPYTSG